MRRLGEAIQEWVKDTPDNPAISDADHAFSYRALDQAMAECRELLKSYGLTAGDRIALIGENSTTLAIFILSAGLDDIWVVLENARRAPLETDAVCEHAQPKRIFYLTENSPSALGHAERHHAKPASASFGSFYVGQELNSVPEECFESAKDQVAALIYTTGSTGIPKGVMLTHANLLYIGNQMKKHRQMAPKDRVYGVLSITHVMGLASGLAGTLVSGAHIRLVPRFSDADCVKSLINEGITVLQGAPAMFSKLANSTDMKDCRPTSLRFIAAGGAPLDPSVKQHVEDCFGLILHNGYGLTEGAAICWTRLDDRNADCTVGPPNCDIEIKILDDERNPVREGERGSLWAKGPNIMKGYFRDAEKTATVLMADGWMNTEDLASRLPDGRVVIGGRSKDLIIRSGFNVSPLEVETAINAHPSVQNCAVLGQKIDGNEEVVAFIELCPGAELSCDDVTVFLKDRLSPYKRPTRIHFIDSLPTAPNGKILKQKVRQILEEQL